MTHYAGEKPGGRVNEETKYQHMVAVERELIEIRALLGEIRDAVAHRKPVAVCASCDGEGKIQRGYGFTRCEACDGRGR